MAMKNKSSQNRNIWYIPVMAVLIFGIVFSAWKLYGIFSEYHEADAEYDDASEEYVIRRSAQADPSEQDTISSQNSAERIQADEEPLFQSVNKECWFSIAFDRIWQTNTDVVGWICNDGTQIDYPVLHGETNDTYLHTTLNGTWNSAGSIFVSYFCTGDPAEDYNTVIYGHNMKNGSMFHSIKSYNSQSYYEEHPYIWYVTPEANYLLYVISATVVTTSFPGYSPMESEEEVRAFVEEMWGYSDFIADYTIDGLDAKQIVETAKRVVILSTCSYEFNDARYVVVAVPLLAQ